MVVVVGLAVVVVVDGDDWGACAAVSSSMAFWTFCAEACCCGLRELVEVRLDVERLLAAGAEQLHRGVDHARALMALTAWVWVTPGAAIVHSVPPLNSIPRFSPPRRMIETIPSRMISVEMPNQMRRLPTKSKRVSPR